MTNTEFAVRLRALAVVYEEHPDAARLYNLERDLPATVYCHVKDTIAATIRAFGPGIKKDVDHGIDYLPTAWPEIRIHIFKHDVCERVKVGEREVPALTIPARVEEVYEWRCGSLLAEGEEVTA